MIFIAGLVLLAVMVGMIVIGRPAKGGAASYLQNWVVGLAYALTVLATGVVGVSLILNDLPF
jgi:hypothetical protein